MSDISRKAEEIVQRWRDIAPQLTVLRQADLNPDQIKAVAGFLTNPTDPCLYREMPMTVAFLTEASRELLMREAARFKDGTEAKGVYDSDDKPSNLSHEAQAFMVSFGNDIKLIHNALFNNPTAEVSDAKYEIGSFQRERLPTLHSDTLLGDFLYVGRANNKIPTLCIKGSTIMDAVGHVRDLIVMGRQGRGNKKAAANLKLRKMGLLNPAEDSSITLLFNGRGAHDEYMKHHLFDKIWDWAGGGTVHASSPLPRSGVIERI